MRSKTIKFVYWVVVAVIIGLILSSCNSAPSAPSAPSAQQLVQSYQQVLPTVVMVRGDRTDDSKKEICNVGTGFFITPRYVLTVAHVADLLIKNTVELQLWNERIISAKKVTTDKFNDLALLQIDPNDIRSYKIPKLNLETYPQVGEMIFIIGSPNSFYGTLTQGILSRDTSKRIAFNWYWSCEVYFTDATTEKGNSGSPVFNARCEIIGIATGHYGKFSVVIPSYSIRAFLKDSISD